MLTVACCAAVVFCCTCILSFLDYFMALSERPDAFRWIDQVVRCSFGWLLTT